MVKGDNTYTLMQKQAYQNGTSNHEEHNNNSDYWDILLGDLKQPKKWIGKSALDFACGKGRNVINIHKLSTWETVDGVDISQANIDYCAHTYTDYKSQWYCNNGVDLQDISSEKYDFVMSTIALQHIPVYAIRRNIIEEILRTLKPGGLFSFQMGFGKDLTDVMGRPKAQYYENIVNAGGTNSEYDVRIQDEKEVIEDLSNIGFVNITTQVRDAYSDYGHPQWIYVKGYKP
jgi:SAM-dependent methyltransferase